MKASEATCIIYAHAENRDAARSVVVTMSRISVSGFIDGIESRASFRRNGIVILAERPGRVAVSRAPSRAASEIRVVSKYQSISIGRGDSNQQSPGA